MDARYFWSAMMPYQKAWLAGNAVMGLIAITCGIVGYNPGTIAFTLITGAMFIWACFQTVRAEHHARVAVETRLRAVETEMSMIKFTAHVGTCVEPICEVPISVAPPVVDMGETCLFFTIINLTGSDIFVSRVWIECDPPIEIVPPEGKIEHTIPWEAIVPITEIPCNTENVLCLGRARLSTEKIIESIARSDVPKRGIIRDRKPRVIKYDGSVFGPKALK